MILRFRHVFAAAFALLLPCAATARSVQIPLTPYKLEVEGKIEFLDVERVEHGSPRQDPEGKIRLRVGSDLSSRLRFQTAMTLMAGGTPRNTRRGGAFNFDDTLQDISPSFEGEEAYFDLYLPRLDTRIGLQKFAWGKLDGIQPNDLLNPEKFYEPVLEDEDDRKVGIPALAPTLFLPEIPSELAPTDLRLTAVWAPIVVPFHFPDQDERWYPPIARVPPESRVMGPNGQELTVENDSTIQNGALPSRGLENGAAAVRFAGLFRGADFALYYFDGFDTTPALDVTARGFVRLNPLNPQGFDIRSEIDIFPVFQRVRAAGGDLAYNVFGATLRAEGAYVQDRLYPRAIRDIVASQGVGEIDPVLLFTGEEQQVPVTLVPANVRRDGVEWGFGGDYLYGDTFLLLQVNQTVVLRNEADLLISDYETRFAMTARQSFWGDRVKAEVIGVYGMQGVYGLAHPRITVNLTDWVDVRIGYLLIEGNEGSIVGQYKHNDEGYVRVRLSF